MFQTMSGTAHKNSTFGQKLSLNFLETESHEVYKLSLCQYCTFTSKTETEMKKQKEKYNITHSNLDYNENLEELNYEIFAT